MAVLEFREENLAKIMDEGDDIKPGDEGTIRIEDEVIEFEVTGTERENGYIRALVEIEEEKGYLMVGCRRHGRVGKALSEEEAEEKKQEHLKDSRCQKFEVMVQDHGFYDHSSRKDPEADTEEKLKEITSERGDLDG